MRGISLNPVMASTSNLTENGRLLELADLRRNCEDADIVEKFLLWS
jgi:hypothetical protein